MTRVSLHESVNGVLWTSRTFVTGPFHSHEKAWEDPCATPASVAFLLRDSRRGGGTLRPQMESHPQSSTVREDTIIKTR